MASPRSFLPGVVTGGTALDTIGLRLDRLFDTGVFWLTVTSAGSEGDTVTADIKDNADTPATDAVPLERGWLNGMGVALIWPATNTGAVTLNVNGSGALDVLTPEGDAIGAGQLPAGIVVRMVYAGGDLIVVSPLPAASSGPQARYFFVFTASGSWAKPAGLDGDTVWTVRCWGGGGGGSNAAAAGGGGGGACAELPFRHGDLASSVAVTIGAGGTVGAAGGAGGNTTFGGLLTAFGGGGGVASSGGGGGGLVSAGSGATGGRLGGGAGGAGAPGADAGNMLSGAGGANDSANAGSAFLGGGGGSHTGVAGTSRGGGNGGAQNVPGAPKGGGGGRNAVGGRGELWIWN